MMGILDLFKRNKHDDLDDLKFDTEPSGSYDFQSSGQDQGPQMPGPANQGPQGGYGEPYGSQGFSGGFSSQGGQDHMVAKELEIISSKLDSIRAMLESLNQRVSSLERVAYGDQNYGPRRY